MGSGRTPEPRAPLGLRESWQSGLQLLPEGRGGEGEGGSSEGRPAQPDLEPPSLLRKSLFLNPRSPVSITEIILLPPVSVLGFARTYRAETLPPSADSLVEAAEVWGGGCYAGRCSGPRGTETQALSDLWVGQEGGARAGL